MSEEDGLDELHEDEGSAEFFVTHWSDIEKRWGQAEEFGLRMEGVEVPGFPPAYTPAEFSTREAPPWLIPGIVPSGLTALFGPTNSGKTFAALDASLSLATGNGWAGQTTTPTNVMYFLAEGQGEAPKRVQSWCLARGVALEDLTGKFWIVPQRLPLAGVEPDGVNIAVVARRLSVGLIVLDTWARTLEGDENSNTDVSRIINLLTDIRANADTSVWVIHHTGYTSDQRMRGASAFAAALDCEIRVEGHLQDPGTPHVAISCTKQRDAAYFDPFLLDVEEHGESITFAKEVRPFTAADTIAAAHPEDVEMKDLVQLLQLGPRSKRDLQVAMGKGEGAVRKMLMVLESEGRVERLEAGTPRCRYRLTQEA